MRRTRFVATAVLLTASVALAQADTGPWHVTTQKSQLTGTTSVMAMLLSSNTMLSDIGQPMHAALIVRCTGSTLDVFVGWPKFMSTDPIMVRWKLDNGPIQTQMWMPSEDGDATFSSHPLSLLSVMSASGKFIIDAPPYQGTTIEAVFRLKDAWKILRKVQKVCPKVAARPH